MSLPCDGYRWIFTATGWRCIGATMPWSGSSLTPRALDDLDVLLARRDAINELPDGSLPVPAYSPPPPKPVLAPGRQRLRIHQPARRGVWTEETVREAARRFQREHGRAPTQVEWSPGEAYRKGRMDLVEAFEAGGYPTYQTAVRVCRSWDRVISS